jgi:hypothetical protein
MARNRGSRIVSPGVVRDTNDHIVAVRYFTALVRDDPAALIRQRTYLDALSAGRSPS